MRIGAAAPREVAGQGSFGLGELAAVAVEVGRSWVAEERTGRLGLIGEDHDHAAMAVSEASVPRTDNCEPVQLSAADPVARDIEDEARERVGVDAGVEGKAVVVALVAEALAGGLATVEEAAGE